MPIETAIAPEVKRDPGYVWAFPGQGIQTPGLGTWLMDESPAGSQVYRDIDRISGQPISEISRNGSKELLSQTEIAQIVIFAYCMAFLADKLSRRKEGFTQPPAYAVGHSLGEAVLLPAVGALDLEPTTPLIQKRGQIMGEVKGTGLVVTMDKLTQAEHEQLSAEVGLELALINTSKQIVYGGKFDQLNEALTRFGSRLRRVNVSAAFHTSYMREAREKFEDVLAKTPFRNAQVPFIANTTGRLIRTKDEIVQELARQFTEPVRFLDAIRLIGNTNNVDKVHEISEKGILLNMIESELGGKVIKTAAAATVVGAAGALGVFIWHKHHHSEDDQPRQ